MQIRAYSRFLHVIFRCPGLLPEILVSCFGTECCAQFHHSSVIGKKEGRAVLLLEFIYKFLIITDEFHPLFVRACSQKTLIKSLRAVAGNIELLKTGVGAEFLVICIVDPGNVMAVAGPVVQAQNGIEGIFKAGHISMTGPPPVRGSRVP